MTCEQFRQFFEDMCLNRHNRLTFGWVDFANHERECERCCIWMAEDCQQQKRLTTPSNAQRFESKKYDRNKYDRNKHYKMPPRKKM